MSRATKAQKKALALKVSADRMHDFRAAQAAEPPPEKPAKEMSPLERATSGRAVQEHYDYARHLRVPADPRVGVGNVLRFNFGAPVAADVAKVRAAYQDATPAQRDQPEPGSDAERAPVVEHDYARVGRDSYAITQRARRTS